MSFFQGNLKIAASPKTGKPRGDNISTARTALLVTWLCILIISIGSATLLLGNTESQAAKILPINVSCVGDSITEWSGYPASLEIMLGNDYKVGNFGVTGAAISPTWHTSYINQWKFYESKDFNPSIVVIMLGTNDAHTYQSVINFPSDYKKLVSEYQELPNHPRIFLVNPPPIYDNDLELNDTYLDSYVIPGIEQVGGELNLPIIDVNNALQNHPEYFEDGVHPNSAGAFAIATEIIDAIDLEN